MRESTARYGRLVANADEVADGVFILRYEAMDSNVCVVRGPGGLLVVDTRSSPAEAAEIESDLQQLGGLGVLGVVNTHAHFDHTFGNQHFAGEVGHGRPIFGHHLLPKHLDEYERPRLAAWRAGTGSEPARDWGEVVITPPTHLVSERQALDVGGRTVGLIPLGRGHTDTDLIVHVPDADVWIVGDVVEESGPPVYGSGCFPLDWADTLRDLLAEVGPRDVVVPGHGLPVTRDFAVAQAGQLATLAELARASFTTMATAEDALASDAPWPFPVDGLRLALERAFALRGRG